MCVYQCDEDNCETCAEGSCYVCFGGGECTSCQEGECQDDASLCTGECHDGCSEGSCVYNDSLCTGPCHDGCSAAGTCIDDDSKCTGECDTCSGGSCEDDDSQCDSGETCCEGTCCDPDGGGNCFLTGQELDDMYDDYETNPLLDGCAYINIDDHRCQHAGDKCSVIQTSLYTDASGAESCLTDAEGCVSAVFWNCYDKFIFTMGFWCTCDDTHQDDPVEIGTHKVCD